MRLAHYLLATTILVPLSVAKFPFYFGDTVTIFVKFGLSFFLFTFVNYRRAVYLGIPVIYSLFSAFPIIGNIIWFLMIFSNENNFIFKNNETPWIVIPLFLFLGLIIPVLISLSGYISLAMAAYFPFFILVEIFSSL
jgi:hypothetical protein